MVAVACVAGAVPQSSLLRDLHCHQRFPATSNRRGELPCFCCNETSACPLVLKDAFCVPQPLGGHFATECTVAATGWFLHNDTIHAPGQPFEVNVHPGRGDTFEAMLVRVRVRAPAPPSAPSPAAAAELVRQPSLLVSDFGNFQPYHFLMEWTFHLFAELAAAAGARVLWMPGARGDPARLPRAMRQVRTALLNDLPARVLASDRPFRFTRLQVGARLDGATLFAQCGSGTSVEALAQCVDHPRPHRFVKRHQADRPADPAWLRVHRGRASCAATKAALDSFRPFVAAAMGAEEAEPRHPGASAGPRLRVFLTQRLHTRKLLNFKQVWDAVERAVPGANMHTGEFSTDMLSNWRLIQLVDVFVAQHGSGLLNLLFSRRDAAAVQLLPSTLRSWNSVSLFAHQTVGEHFLGPGRMRSVCCQGVLNGTNRKNTDMVCNPATVADTVLHFAAAKAAGADSSEEERPRAAG